MSSDKPDPDSGSAAAAPEILLDDGPVLAVNKPAGILTLGAKPGVPTLERAIKEYLKVRFQKPGNVYLGIPHRLDRPVSGVIVFARNSKAAARLAEQFRERQVRKIYWAVTEQCPDPSAGVLSDLLLKTPDAAHVSVAEPGTPGAREAKLRYRKLEQLAGGTLLEIEPETGRMHQIRVQLAARGWPVVGDTQYGASTPFGDVQSSDPSNLPSGHQIALHARELTFLHPIRYDQVTVAAPVPADWSQLGFSQAAPIGDHA